MGTAAAASSSTLPTHGRCYLWGHDDAYVLVPISNSFAEARAAIESGFVAGDKRINTILN